MHLKLGSIRRQFGISLKDGQVAFGKENEDCDMTLLTNRLLLLSLSLEEAGGAHRAAGLALSRMNLKPTASASH